MFSECVARASSTRPIGGESSAAAPTAAKPNQAWVGGISYIHTDEGWLYLAVAMDLWSRKVVDWSMRERITATQVCNALRMALFQRKRLHSGALHTARGVSTAHASIVRDSRRTASSRA